MRRYFIEQYCQKANFKKFWLLWYSEDSLAKGSKENSPTQSGQGSLTYVLAVVRQGAFVWTVWPRCPRRILSDSLLKAHLHISWL